MSKAARL